MQSQSGIKREIIFDTLNQLLDGELAAVATYTHALEKFNKELSADLIICMQSHVARSKQLQTHIIEAGGIANKESGFWPGLTCIVASAARVIGAQTILRVLVEGEEQNLADYQIAMQYLDAAGQELSRKTLLPEQIRTYGIVSSLYRGFNN